ncbi:unnamed protein product [Rotaria sp. Silwood2]|nr:unnamed protein product [Rotaria sp. Silwood2]
MKKEIGDETNIKVLGNVLKDMGLYDKALQCYEKLLKQSKPNDLAILSCYYGIGQVMQLKGDYGGSLWYFEKVLDLESKFPSKDKMISGLTHNYIGIAYHYGKTHDYTRTLYHYQKALDIHLEVKGPEFVGTTYVHNNLATLHRALEDYDKSLEYYFKCLDLKKTLFGTEQDWRISSTYNSIGAVYSGVSRIFSYDGFHVYSMGPR